MTFGPVSVDEVRPLLPTFDKSRPIRELAKAEGREQVALNLCFASGSFGDLERSVLDKLTAAGWLNAKFQESDEHDGKTRALTARKPPYNLTGELARASVAGCDAANGETVLGLLVYRLVPKSP